MNGTMQDLRVMVIGAHPDDPDLNFGGSAVLFVRAGARVRFVSVCSGSKGHRTMPEPELAARRFGEMQNSAAVLGIEKYETLGCPDCELEPSMEWKRRLTKTIREFAPHLIFTHRTCDYHADHRACGQLVTDVTYFLGVPHWCPESPCMDNGPCVMFMRDKFTIPGELRPDVAVDITDVQNIVADAVSCHESQIYEWLPPEIPGCGQDNPGAGAPAAVKREFVKKYWFGRKEFDADRFGLPFKYAEVFEMSEYGRQLTSEELRAVFPAGTFVRERNVNRGKV